MTVLDPWREVAPTPAEPQPKRPILAVRRLAVMAAEVDRRGPRQWLIQGIWPAGDYGVHGAEPKAGKTWNALDLAVSVASGTPWLSAVPVGTSGPVVVFAGEGGEGNLVRRIRAIAVARGVPPDDLQIWLCTRVPHLSQREHLDDIKRQLSEIGPRLVIIDPLYLAASGANGSDLYAMAGVLESIQHLCQAAHASLFVVTHYNRSRDLKGAARITGAGPAEWGRVLLTADLLSRHTDPATKASTVLTRLDVVGGEIPDQTMRLRRTVRAVEPSDLDSPLVYEVVLLDADEPDVMPPGSDLAPAAIKLLAAVETLATPSSVKELVDWIASRYGHGLTRETCSRHLSELRARGLIDYLDPGQGKSRLWLRPSSEERP